MDQILNEESFEKCKRHLRNIPGDPSIHFPPLIAGPFRKILQIKDKMILWTVGDIGFFSILSVKLICIKYILKNNQL